jgi:hypothetical protein
MAAAKAFQLKIRAGTKHLPPLFTAWMLLFHDQNVV